MEKKITFGELLDLTKDYIFLAEGRRRMFASDWEPFSNSCEFTLKEKGGILCLVVTGNLPHWATVHRDLKLSEIL